MEPEKRAIMLKKAISQKLGYLSEEMQIQGAITYVETMLQIFPMIPGDYKMLEYQDEWYKYEEYYHDILAILRSELASISQSSIP